ncbi:MAG: U32 family peptidase [Desulfobacterota bacterium]|nr:U32 family peptidase [Thermodesulfobacteriota bacterium]
MKYSIATNWDLALLDRLEGTEVESLYGQIWGDPLGGGRMALFIPKVDRGAASTFIREARRRGLGFNYLMNGTCLDNLEFTKKGYGTLVEHIEWVASTGADMVTVTLPFLLEVVKREVPPLKVAVSSFARVVSVQQARAWREMGADKIILPESVNRDFRTLQRIREAVDCELELIANHCCLFQCFLDLHHRNMVSHGSQAGHPCGGFAPDYCKLACQRLKLLRPEELIKSTWIRPEDVPSYEEIGIDCLKLVERFRGTESLLQIVHAYERQRFEGNLVDLLSLPQAGAFLSPNLEILARTDLVEPEKMEAVMAVLREPFSGRVHIDNKRLDGFLDFFKEKDCLRMDCERCGYCKGVARRVIRIDEAWRGQMVARFERAMTMLTTGEVAGFLKV